jgi:ribosome assembly protein 1
VAADGSHSNSIVAGFQLATVSGPLCDEPMWGVALRVEATLCGTDPREEQFGPFSGQLISVTREACRAALLAAGARLVEAQYMCEVCCNRPLSAVCGWLELVELLAIGLG